MMNTVTSSGTKSLEFKFLHCNISTNNSAVSVMFGLFFVSTYRDLSFEDLSSPLACTHYVNFFFQIDLTFGLGGNGAESPVRSVVTVSVLSARAINSILKCRHIEHDL